MIGILIKVFLLLFLSNPALGDVESDTVKTTILDSESALFCDSVAGLASYYECIEWVEFQKYFLGDRYVGFECKEDPANKLCPFATTGRVTYRLYKTTVIF